MKSLPLWILLGELLVLRPVIAATVPDESVIPQWSTTLRVMLKAREANFLAFRATNKPPERPLTDEELLNGVKSQRPNLPWLDGAEDCQIEENQPAADLTWYRCYFLPTGPSAADMQSDFVRLVRLVEKATGVTATRVSNSFVNPSFENHNVHVGMVVVDSKWSPNSTCQVVSLPVGKTRLGSCLLVWINSPLPPGYSLTSTPTGKSREIDEIIKSGRYTQMPPAERAGSSGSGLASIRITNSTAYTLTIVYDGVASATSTIPAHGSSTLQLPAGSFRVLGRVSEPGVLPFIGRETFGPGDNLVTDFFVK
ncbi:MAG: hypothetical protein WBW33_10595 [Bryobacteraceae bacterium]